MDPSGKRLTYIVSKKIVARCFPDELPSFEDLWDSFEKTLTGEDESATTNGLRNAFFAPIAKKDGGYRSESIVACVRRGIDVFLAQGEEPDWEAFKELVRRTMHANHSLPNEEVESICNVACFILAGDLARARNLRGSGKASFARTRYQPDSLLPRLHAAASQQVSARGPIALSMSLNDGTRQVNFRGTEDAFFRSRERLYCLFLRLAAARSKGDGWLHRTNDLHELDARAHGLYELKQHLQAVTGLRDVLVTDGRRQGRVRLEMPSGCISLSKTVCEFCSHHMSFVTNCLEEMPPSKDLREKHFARYENRIWQETEGLARNCLLVAEAVKDMGWRLCDQDCLRVLEDFLSRVPGTLWGEKAKTEGLVTLLRAALS